MLSTVIISIIDHTVEQAFVRNGGTCLLWQIMKMKGVKTQNDQFHVRQRKAAKVFMSKRDLISNISKKLVSTSNILKVKKLIGWVVESNAVFTQALEA